VDDRSFAPDERVSIMANKPAPTRDCEQRDFDPAMAKTCALVNAMRPHQWIKNSFILLPLVFAQRVFDIHAVLASLLGVAIFCALTSSVYLYNDIIDVEADRKHPVKKNRPLAAGLISTRLAVVTAICLLLLALISGYFLQRSFFAILVAYLLIQILYNYRLKEVVILDIFCVSSGFFLRVAAGAAVIEAPMSRWMIICTTLIAVFLTLCKRRNELMILGKDDAGSHRKVLDEYSVEFLDQMIGITSGATLLSYLLYVTSTETIEKFHTDRLIYTFPFVLYGLFRYLYLIHQKREGGSPEKLFFSDAPILSTVVIWGLICFLITNGVF